MNQFIHLKKWSSLIIALITVLTLSLTAFAADNSQGSLSSTGNLHADSAVWVDGNLHLKSLTTSQKQSYRMKTEMQAVYYYTGAYLDSDIEEKYNTKDCLARKEASSGITATVYGSHQVWGNGNEYWGVYTSNSNA